MVTSDGLDVEESGKGFSTSHVFFNDRDSKYYFRAANGDYFAANERDLTRRLKRMGLSPFTNPKAGELVSDIDEELMKIQEQQRVDYALAMAGHRRGVLEMGAKRILITKELKLIEPKKGSWDTLRALIDGLFIGYDDEGDVVLDQTPYIYGWLSVAMEGLYSGRPNKGQALIVPGEPGCGKTLLLSVLTEMFGGVSGKPYAYMVGVTKFNDELFESSLLAIDDEADKTDIKSRRHLVAELKKILVNDRNRCEGKGLKALELSPHWRVLMLSNLEEDNLRVLPPLDGDVIGKLIILKAHRHKFSMPVSTQHEKRAFFEQLLADLPGFLWYLLNEYEIPDEYQGERFGVCSYLNPEIVSYMDNVTAWAELLLTLERVFLKGSRKFMVESSSGIIERLRDRNGLLTHREQERYTATAVGKMMSEIASRRPKRCWQARSGYDNGRVWVLLKDGVSRAEVEAELEVEISKYGMTGLIEDENGQPY